MLLLRLAEGRSVTLRVIAVVLGLFTSLLAHAWKPEVGERPEPMEVVEYVDGRELSLPDLYGKPTVLYFGADWCIPCIERGRPTMISVAKKYVPQGLQVVFISMDDNKFRENKVKESSQIGIPIAMAKLSKCAPNNCPDGLRDLGRFGRIFVYPTAIVLDSEGFVRAKVDRGIGVQGGLESSVIEVMKSFKPSVAALTTKSPPQSAVRAASFEGDWEALMTCPEIAEKSTKGYSARFSGQVKEGTLRISRGLQGESGWQLIHGAIDANGEANLTLEGLTGDPSSTAGNAARGTSFTSKVVAKFDPTSGSGQRTTGRACEIKFTRR